MFDCPSCDNVLENKRGMKIHHKMAHDESLATETTECNNCDEQFEYYPSEKEGYYCSDCSEKVVWETHTPQSGRSHPNYSGGKHIEKCNICCNYFTTYNKKQKTCSKVCGNLQSSKTISGNNHWRWRGGRIKYGQNWHREKRKCKERQNNECQICGEKKVEVHHKKPVREFDDPNNAHFQDNLVCLCPEHHRKVEFGKIEL
jgi:hypothetical protein